MNRNEIREALSPNCPVRNVLSRVGDKWSMLVLFTLEANRSQRFKELQRNIPVAASPASSHDLTGYDIVAGKESLSKNSRNSYLLSL